MRPYVNIRIQNYSKQLSGRYPFSSTSVISNNVSDISGACFFLNGIGYFSHLDIPQCCFHSSLVYSLGILAILAYFSSL